MLKEFRDFIARGNVVDMAVGIIVGAAFTAIVRSVVSDLIDPVIGLIIGGIDFSDMYVVLSGSVPDGASLAAAREEGAAIFAYGAFITAVINFMIIAFVVFMLVKAINRMRAAAEAHRKAAEEQAAVADPPPGPSELQVLLEIRDELRKRDANAAS
ncbi:large conductance mechanosensitive channel protein MscL [Martelella mediterranea]|uniref:large conductance mechanosensitive channel protein MscL n=1 Tax=Martelella mediterranea TaxID=293089 RepID=UPI001E49400D|nr:large conductance mechanosensitive channel protein MscL [Martelella mediterranea]MCD1633011.1 large conductance mechanosensitive channel protein MscL [Martelella mediterranea]